MVQVGAPFGYDNGVDEDEKQEPTWTKLIKDAAKEFVGNLTESSKQLATAAEKLAADSLHALEDATSKVQSSATASSDMATAAKEAAAEAQRIAESVSASVSEAIEKVKEEAQAAFKEVMQQQVDQSVEGAGALKDEVERRLDEMGQRLEESLMRFESYVDANQRASDQVKQALGSSQQVKTEVDQRVDAAIERLEAIANANQEAIASVQQAADSALQTANEAKDQVSRIEQTEASPSLGLSAQAVLERLEADYQLLAQLVQELHSRIASLNEASPTEEMPAAAEPEEEPASAPEVSAWTSKETQAEPTPVTSPALGSLMAIPPVWEAESPTEEAEEETAAAEASQPASWETPYREPSPYSQYLGTPTPAEASSAAGGSVSGRILVKLSPVPDFDRLLNLDGALGRLSGVRNVTLADYAQEEVSFRIEVDNAMSPEDFCQRLSESAGSAISVVSATSDSLTLHLN